MSQYTFIVRKYICCNRFDGDSFSCIIVHAVVVIGASKGFNESVIVIFLYYYNTNFYCD